MPLHNKNKAPQIAKKQSGRQVRRCSVYGLSANLYPPRIGAAPMELSGGLAVLGQCVAPRKRPESSALGSVGRRVGFYLLALKHLKVIAFLRHERIVVTPFFEVAIF